jgi:DNA polymerase III alpha subunit (gram-positive type)
MSKYIAFDNETGGLNPETSLLTTYFAILDANFNKVDELELLLKPNNNEPYVVEAQGLEINKINLIEHDKVALTYSMGGQQLVQLLKKHFVGGERLIPLGHNVHFDILGINNHLLGAKTWNQYVSYRMLDTQIIARFMQTKGYISMDTAISLTSLGQHFNIHVPYGGAHESKYDTLLTIEVYKALLKL